MTRIVNSQAERLKRATVHPTDVWQGGIFRAPAWIREKKREPYRALLPLWISVETGAAFVGDILRPEELDPARALDALAEGALHSPFGGYRPGRLEVTNPLLADYLRDQVSELGIEISKVDRLEHVNMFLRAMGEDTSGPMSMCAALDEPGVTLERMSAFADAAADFFRAKLWNHLSNIDLVRVESPVPDPDLAHFAVVSAGGRFHGLGFFSSMEEFETLLEADVPPEMLEGGTVWSLSYGPIMGLPFPDVDLWEDHDLSVAGPDAYPFLLCTEDAESYRRPDAQSLAFVEGLLRALARTTEDDLDSGRWTKSVPTFDGKANVTLALPAILHPRPADTTDQRSAVHDRWGMEKALLAVGQMLEEKKFDSVEEINSFLEREVCGKPSPELKIRNPREKALDLFYQAIEAEGRMQIKLARQALAIDPDCADAYVLLAENMPDPQRRLELYHKGVEAGERMIGKKAFKEDAGHFWGITKTRPYMRARVGVAQCLRSSGRVDEAIGHYRDLLRLNPNDNQGIRYLLLPLLLEREEDAEAHELLETYDGDVSAPIAYGQALLAFRKEGDSPAARKQLDMAIKRNPHMVKFILGSGKIPDELPEYFSLGSKEEAIAHGPDARPAWETTPGAIQWLKNRRKAGGTGKRGRR